MAPGQKNRVNSTENFQAESRAAKPMMQYFPATARVWLCTLLAVIMMPLHCVAQTLSIGLIPSEDPRVMASEYQPLIDYLAKALRMEVKAFVATDYNGVMKLCARKNSM